MHDISDVLFDQFDFSDRFVLFRIGAFWIESLTGMSPSPWMSPVLGSFPRATFRLN